jgi:hypothetical protein
MTKKKKPGPQKGLPLALDLTAKSANPTLPAFLTPPEDEPVYYGFPVLDDVEVDGFKLGIITDFEAEPTDWGDAFIVAPDGSRAGLVWEVSDKTYLLEALPLQPRRWGVWEVPFPFPMRSRADARRNLETVLPVLKEKWEQWKKKYK